MLINTYELINQKSKFIGYLYDIDDVNQIDGILDNLKNMHPHMRHMPYAYIIGPNMKKTDDKEPSNTAGMPIYNQLMYHHLDHHLLVIVRYFGGTKLGAGNLLRTYVNCAKLTIEGSIS